MARVLETFDTDTNLPANVDVIDAFDHHNDDRYAPLGSGGTGGEAVSPAEFDAALLHGLIPRLEVYPPTVTVSNNQGLDGTPTAAALIPNRQANAAGWYTSISPLDTAKQRYFAPSAPQNSQAAPSPDTWSVQFKRGGVAGAPFAQEFRMTGGQVVQFMVKQMGGTAFRILVNGKYLSRTHVAVGGTAGQIAFITIDFGAPLTSPADITFEGTSMSFYGVIHQTTSTITKVPGPEPKRIIFALDSYGGGSQLVTGLTSMVRTAGWLMGWRAVLNSSIGGSGWINGGNNSEPPLSGRVQADVIDQAPDVVVIGLGHNDTTYTDDQIKTAVTNTATAIRAGLPNAQIIVTGPLFSTPTPGRYASMQAAIFAGVAGIANVVTVDTTGNPWITNKNASKYVSSDNTHPVQLGADYFGFRYAALISEALAVKF
jgi:lysophospholipase L1-like esterase